MRDHREMATKKNGQGMPLHRHTLTTNLRDRSVASNRSQSMVLLSSTMDARSLKSTG